MKSDELDLCPLPSWYFLRPVGDQTPVEPVTKGSSHDVEMLMCFLNPHSLLQDEGSSPDPVGSRPAGPQATGDAPGSDSCRHVQPWM